jgi:hypothetical protein
MIRAALSVCILSTVCNLAVAGPVARTTNAVATVAPDTPPAVTQPQARVYLFRGALGPIFSRGMDRLTKRLQDALATAQRDPAYQASLAKQGASAGEPGPESFAKLIRKDAAKWKAIIQGAGIKVE